jgi:iron complex outermembrane receptor protein
LLPKSSRTPADIYGLEFGSVDHWFNGSEPARRELTDARRHERPGQNEVVPEGAPIPFAPETTLTAGIQYDFPIGDMLLTPRMQVAYIDEQLATPFPNVATIVPSHTVADIKLNLQVNDNWSVEGFVNNVFDETYIATQLQDAGPSSAGEHDLRGATTQHQARVPFLT